MKIQFTKDQIEKLLETYGINNVDNILNEDIRSSIIGRLLGTKLVSKLEANYGDDAVRILDNLFAAAESRSGNIITGVDKKLYLVSASGKKWSMETIKKVIDGVASGKLPASDLELLPKTLKDGQEFRKIIQNQFKYGKPKPVITDPAIPTPKPATPKPATPNPYESLKPITIPQETKDAFIEMMNKKGIKISSKAIDNVMLEVQKSVDKQLGSLEKTFTDPTFIKTLESYNRLPLSEQNEIVQKAINSVKESYGTYLGGLRISEKSKQNLQALYDKSVDAFFLGKKQKGQWIKWGELFDWYKKSVGISLSLFAYSIYVEAVRNENKGFWKNIDFALDKFVETPDRLFKSLLPGANLLYSSTSALKQSFLFLGEYIVNKLSGRSDKKPTLKQKIKTGVEDVVKYKDSTVNANQPKIDSLRNVYEPKIDSTLQKIKTDYENRSTNTQPTTNDNRPVIKY